MDIQAAYNHSSSLKAVNNNFLSCITKSAFISFRTNSFKDSHQELSLLVSQSSWQDSNSL
jgi:hypothetical protein